MDSIAQVTEAMQVVLTIQANQIAQETGFVRRTSKLTGSKFAQTVVLTWLADPQATYEQLAQTATALGAPITAQGIDQRFTPEAAKFLQRVLAAAVEQVIQAAPVAIPLLQRFNGVYVQDGTTLALPAELAEEWPGCGNQHQTASAALKVQLQFNCSDGHCVHLDLQAGCDSDRSAPMQTAVLPAGALRLADLGYYALPTWAAYTQQQVFWLSRFPPQCAVYDEQGVELDLPHLLPRLVGPTYDQSVRVSQKHQLPARLVAQRVAPAVAAARRRKIRADAQRKGYTPSARSLALCEWVLWLTNVPLEKLNADEVVVMARVRWQIELVFKLWKAQGHV
ncbi:MAG TPA: IS4 family transposase, partial [Anaerolineales bacterium]